MSLWALFFIFLVVVMAVGPVMMFKPGKKMQALDKLRSGAAQRGLRVRLATYSSRQQERQVAVYFGTRELGTRELGASEKQHSIAWTLLKNDVAHDIHFFERWDWVGNRASLSQDQTHTLKAFLQQLPDTVVGVELQGKSSGLWWLESKVQSWGLDELEACLKQLNAIFY